jgi:hypothetical protein
MCSSVYQRTNINWIIWSTFKWRDITLQCLVSTDLRSFSVLPQMAVCVVHVKCMSHIFFHHLICWEHNRNQHYLLAVVEAFPIHLTCWQPRPPMQDLHLPCNSSCFTLVHHSLTPRQSLVTSLYFIYIKPPFSWFTSSAVYVRPSKYSFVVFIILHPCCMLK